MTTSARPPGSSRTLPTVTAEARALASRSLTESPRRKLAACRSVLTYADAMKILVLGAGNVGRAVVDALYEQHEITVIDDVTPTSLAFILSRDLYQKPRGSLAIATQNIKISQVPGPCA